MVLSRHEIKDDAEAAVEHAERVSRREASLARLPPHERLRRREKARREEAAAAQRAAAATTSYGRLVRAASASTASLRTQLAYVRRIDRPSGASSAAALPGLRGADAPASAAPVRRRGASSLSGWPADPILNMYKNMPLERPKLV